MFGLISSNALHDHATRMVDAFVQAGRLSPEGSRKTASKAAADAALQVLFRDVGRFCLERKLSFIGRARLAKALQSELRLRGFSGDLVSKVTTAVMINVLAAPVRKDKS